MKNRVHRISSTIFALKKRRVSYECEDDDSRSLIATNKDPDFELSPNANDFYDDEVTLTVLDEEDFSMNEKSITRMRLLESRKKITQQQQQQQQNNI